MEQRVGFSVGQRIGRDFIHNDDFGFEAQRWRFHLLIADREFAHQLIALKAPD